MSAKPAILVFIDWFWPGYLAGGPVQSIVSMVHYLHRDFNFKIVTTNYDLNSKTPYPGIQPGVWTQSPLGCEVFYIDPKNLDAAAIKAVMESTPFDAAYINSFFSKHFSITPLYLLNRYYHDTPVILAPRGMLGSGALAIKRYKKLLFLLYARLSGLHKRVLWHATSEQEHEEIRKVIGSRARIRIVSNLPKRLQAPASRQKAVNELNLCFISRISVKKNLLFALKVLGRIRGMRIRYSIYGPIEDAAYWSKCQAEFAGFPSNMTVDYKGLLDPSQVEQAYAHHHFLFLPTYNENFGHAIVESLLCGCPAIISDQTPWKDLEAANAGYAIALDNEKRFEEVIRHCAGMDQAAFDQTSAAAQNYIHHKIDLELIFSQYKSLFNECIKNRSLHL